MNFFKKIDAFNQYISFHIFGCNGFLCFAIVLYLNSEYHRLLRTTYVSWGDAFFWLTYCASALALSIFIIAFIIFLFERAFNFKIKNKFLLENKTLKLFRYIGSIFSLIYLSLIFALLFYVIFLWFAIFFTSFQTQLMPWTLQFKKILISNSLRTIQSKCICLN